VFENNTLLEKDHTFSFSTNNHTAWDNASIIVDEIDPKKGALSDPKVVVSHKEYITVVWLKTVWGEQPRLISRSP